MQPRAPFASVLSLALLFLCSGVAGAAVLSSPADVHVMVGQTAALYCTAKCSHRIKWSANYRNLRTIVVGSNREGVKVSNFADHCNSPSSSSNHTQVLEINPVTPAWHGKAVQCRARQSGSVVFSRFATIYVDGIDNAEIPCATQAPLSQKTVTTNTYDSSSQSTAQVTQLLPIAFILVSCLILP